MKPVLKLFIVVAMISLPFRMNSQVATQPSNQEQAKMETYSMYDFIAGEKVIFYDDFTSENIGDFPQLWNTNGSGEIVTTNLFPGRWFKITSGSGATCLLDPLTLRYLFRCE
jgi:hypothetical protein